MVVVERTVTEMKQATLSRFVEERKFSEAASLLKRHTKEAEIIDPRRDDSWGIDADILGYAILEYSGVPAFCSYWQDLLHFFIRNLVAPIKEMRNPVFLKCFRFSIGR